MSLLTNNWLPKLVSVALAIVAWYFISLNVATISQRNLEIPVSVVGLEQTQTITEIPENVSITVSGDSRQVNRLVPENFTATLNVAGLNGEYSQKIEVIPPQGIVVEKVSPEISIGTIESIRSKEVPVSIVVLPGQDKDLHFQAVPEQPTVTVQGRESILERIAQVTGLVAPQIGEVTVGLYATDANQYPIGYSLEVALNPAILNVSITATPVLHLKNLPLVVAVPRVENYVVREFTLSQDTLTVIGTADLLESLERITGSIELPDTLSQRHNLPVNLDLPGDVNTLQRVTASFSLMPINPLAPPGE